MFVLYIAFVIVYLSSLAFLILRGERRTKQTMRLTIISEIIVLLGSIYLLIQLAISLMKH